MTTTPTLVCTSGGRKGESWEITAEGVRLGREDSNDVALVDPNVSRFHGRVILHNNAIWIQDAGSRNGIFVNDKRVTSNKQVKPGDTLRMGAHSFAVELLEIDTEQSLTVNMKGIDLPPSGRPKKGWKLWPFALAGLLILGCVGLISARSGESGGDQGSDAADPAPSGYSLAAALDGAKEAAEQPKDAPSEAMGLTDALEVASGSKTSGQDKWPDPPEGVGAGELVDQGHGHYRAGRLRDALTHYQMALKVDQDCEICRRRIDRLNGEIADQVQENFESGLQYYQSLQYQQAINAWETVLLLEPDESAAMHVRTKGYLDKARRSINPQY